MQQATASENTSENIDADKIFRLSQDVQSNGRRDSTHVSKRAGTQQHAQNQRLGTGVSKYDRKYFTTEQIEVSNLNVTSNDSGSSKYTITHDGAKRCTSNQRLGAGKSQHINHALKGNRGMCACRKIVCDAELPSSSSNRISFFQI